MNVYVQQYLTPLCCGCSCCWLYVGGGWRSPSPPVLVLLIVLLPVLVLAYTAVVPGPAMWMPVESRHPPRRRNSYDTSFPLVPNNLVLSCKAWNYVRYPGYVFFCAVTAIHGQSAVAAAAGVSFRPRAFWNHQIRQFASVYWYSILTILFVCSRGPSIVPVARYSGCVCSSE